MSVIYRSDIDIFVSKVLCNEVPNIILVSNKRYSAFHAKVQEEQRRITRFIIDEPDTISLPNNKRIKADFTWLVTGTYTNLNRGK